MSEQTGGAAANKPFNYGAFYAKYGTLVILFSILIIAALLSENFIKPTNLTNVLRQISVVTVIGFGVTFILILGQINIAYDSLIALIGCTSVMIMVSTQNLLVSVVAGIFMGAVIGLFYGVLVAYLKIPSFIVGLAFNTIARGIILIVTNGKAISANLGNFSVIGQGYVWIIPITVIIMFVLLGVSWFILNKTCFGRHVFAVGGNRSAAIASGIRADVVIVKAYVLDGVLAGIGSVVFMSRLSSGQPSAGVGYAFDAITAVVVGGTSLAGGSGGVIGTVIGAAIVGVINNLMNLMNVNSYWQQVVKGVIILVAVMIDILTKQNMGGRIARKSVASKF